MKIKGLGLELKRLRYEHIELVRYWRNHPEISVFMDYNDFITAEMQKKWFDHLDAAKDFYFIISYENKFIGLIHLSDINWKFKTGQAGLFIWEKYYWQTQVPVLASLNLIDFAFRLLHLKSMEAKVMKNNTAALSYNQMLGFQIDSTTDRYYRLKLNPKVKTYQSLLDKLHPYIEKKPVHFTLENREYDLLSTLNRDTKKAIKQLIEDNHLSLKN